MAANQIEYVHTDYLDSNDAASLLYGAITLRPLEGSTTIFEDVAAYITLYGAPQAADSPYVWSKAGCYGQAVYDAGIPGAE